MTGLRRHVPELAIDWMMDMPERRWRVIDGSLVFADISGFTALAERLAQRGRVGGEELVETLSRVFAGMLDAAHQRGGMLLKFGGDALLLFFEGAGHPMRAASAAVEMRSALRKSAEIPTSVGPLRLSMSVGIHSGDAHFFLVGSTHRELVVLGPGANAVVSTENAANSGEILLSSGAAARLPKTASKSRADGLPMLRWRRPATVAAALPVAREADDALVARLFPRALGKFLAVGAPEPEHRVACIAFARFSGTDHLLATEGGDAVAAALQETVSIVQACLAEDDVTLLAIDIDKDGGKFFMGSGVPFAHEDDEGAMLRALRRIVDAAAPLPLQIGVNRGHVFAAEVGSRERAAYSAMGDTTNTAARIASKAPPGTIYAHPSVLDESLTLFAVQPAGPLSLKGKALPLPVYAIGRETGTRRREGLEAALFVERTAERAAIGEALAALAEGRGGVVTLTGSTGIGKSRLLRETTAEAGRSISLRAEPYGASSPYRLFRDPFRSLLGIERDGPEAMARALAQRIADIAPELLTFASLLGDITHIDIEPSEDVRHIQPNFRSERRAAVVIELLDALTREPLLFLIDDAHWVDEASQEILHAIARACASRPWLMLVARRDVATGFEPNVGSSIELPPISEEGMRSLIEAATEAAPLRPFEMAEIVRRAGGNPLFAMELVRAVRDLGSLDAVPQSLEAAMAAQIDALDPDARRLARYATVLGRRFSHELLAEMLAAEGFGRDLSALDRLGDHIEPDGPGHGRFSSGLLRDVLYESLAYRLRQRLHRIAGDATERHAPDPAAVADALALHFSHGDEPERAWRYTRLAAERARRTYANVDAARFYQLAIDASHRLPAIPPGELVSVWTALGEVRELAGQFQAALSAYGRGFKLVGDDPVAQAELLLKRARATERDGRFSAALREITRAKQQLTHAADRTAAGKTLAKIESFAAMIYAGQDRRRLSLRTAEAAFETASRFEEHEAQVRALAVIEIAHMELHGPGDGRYLEHALEIAQSLGDITLEARVRTNLGVLHSYAGRWDEANDWFATARPLDARRGDALNDAYGAANIAENFVSQRRYDEAEPLLAQALRTMRALEFPEGVATIELQLARIRLGRGEFAAAASLSERVARDFERIGQPRYALEAHVLNSEAVCLGGDPRRALDLLDDAVSRSSEVGFLIARIARTRGEILAALGHFADAEAEVARGLRAAREQRLRYDEALLLRARGAIASLQGGAPQADDEAACRALFEGLGVRPWPAHNREAAA